MDIDMDADMDLDTSRGLNTSKGKGKGKQSRVDGPSDNLPWVEKYRPASLDDVVSHHDIVSTIDRFIDANRLPHLLFYGPPGTGKTSMILACARKMYGPNFRNSVLELNASDDRGIDVVREQIKTFASTRTMFSTGFKLIILDECDAMTNAAQNALRRIIEKYTRNVRFCIICNYVNKIAPAIQSRCTRFRFAPLPIDQVQKRLRHVITQEGVNITHDGVEALLKLSKGDMRRALNILQACHAAYDTVNEEAIYNCTGNPQPQDINRIMNTMLSDDFLTAFRNINNIKTDRGLALQDIISGVYDEIEELQMPAAARIHLIDLMSQTEHRLSTGGSEKIQTTSLLGAFKQAVELMGNA